MRGVHGLRYVLAQWVKIRKRGPVSEQLQVSFWGGWGHRRCTILIRCTVMFSVFITRNNSLTQIHFLPQMQQRRWNMSVAKGWTTAVVNFYTPIKYARKKFTSNWECGNGVKYSKLFHLRVRLKFVKIFVQWRTVNKSTRPSVKGEICGSPVAKYSIFHQAI